MTERLDTPEFRAWLAKQWESRPERDDAWLERVLSIYAAGDSQAEGRDTHETPPPTD